MTLQMGSILPALLLCAAGLPYANAEASTTSSEFSDPAAVEELRVTGHDRRSYQADHASVATRSDTSLIETPQSVSVVTAAVIADSAPLSLDEALQTVAGVKQGNTLGGTQDAIIKRGFGTNRDNSIMVDGLQSVRARNFTAATDRIEVLKGPSSILYDVQDPGGVINVVTKRPQAAQRATLSGWLTSWGGGGEQADVTGPIGKGGLLGRLIVDQQNYQYWRNFGHISQTDVAPSLSWSRHATEIHLDYEYMRYAIPFDRGTQIDTRTGLPLDIPRSRRLDEPFNITHGDSHDARLGLTQQLNDAWSLRMNYGFSRNYYNDNQARTIAVDPVTGIVTRRSDSTRDAAQNAHVVQAEAVGIARIFGMRHEILLGADYLQNYRNLGDLIRDKQQKTFNAYTPVYGLTPEPSLVSAADSGQTDKLRSIAVFAEEQIHLTSRWILQAGIRYSQVHELTGKGRPFRTNTLVDRGKATPRAGLVYLIRPELSVYASYSQSFRPNTSIATAIGALPPEQGEAWESGVKYINSRITATAAAFRIDKRNVQTTQQINDITYTRVAGKVRSQGLELELNGQLSRNWSVSASYALTDTLVLKDPVLQGEPLDAVSKHAGTLMLTRDFGTVGPGHLRGGGSLRAFSRWGATNGSGLVYYMPPAKVVDAFMAYDVRIARHPVALQLNARNLFDETYYISDSGSTQPAITIGEPRSFLFSVKTTL